MILLRHDRLSKTRLRADGWGAPPTNKSDAARRTLITDMGMHARDHAHQWIGMMTRNEVVRQPAGDGERRRLGESFSRQ